MKWLVSNLLCIGNRHESAIIKQDAHIISTISHSDTTILPLRSFSLFDIYCPPSSTLCEVQRQRTAVWTSLGRWSAVCHLSLSCVCLRPIDNDTSFIPTASKPQRAIAIWPCFCSQPTLFSSSSKWLMRAQSLSPDRKEIACTRRANVMLVSRRNEYFLSTNIAPSIPRRYQILFCDLPKHFARGCIIRSDIIFDG